MEGQVIQLDDGATAYIQHIAVQNSGVYVTHALRSVSQSLIVYHHFLIFFKLSLYFLFVEEPSGLSGAAMSDVESLEAGQAVQLEDGSTAYLHHIPKGFSEFFTQVKIFLDGKSQFLILSLNFPTHV